MTAEPNTPRRRRPRVMIGVVFLAGLVFAAWYGWLRTPRQPAVQPDSEAAAHANARGVGLMEQFDYSAAVKAFEEVVQRAPDWLPGRINLGIALLNTATPDNLQRARDVFRQVLEKEPEN